jgi:hypothetical protein
LPRSARDASNAGIDLRFWTVAALVGIGFLYVLFRSS